MTTRCQATNKDGTRCKRMLVDGSVCHLHQRAMRASAARRSNVVRFPLREQAAPLLLKHDATEFANWCTEVRRGERFYTQDKVVGGDAMPVPVDVYPNWDDRLKAGALELRAVQVVESGGSTASKDQLRADLAEMLGLSREG